MESWYFFTKNVVWRWDSSSVLSTACLMWKIVVIHCDIHLYIFAEVRYLWKQPADIYSWENLTVYHTSWKLAERMYAEFAEESHISLLPSTRDWDGSLKTNFLVVHQLEWTAQLDNLNCVDKPKAIYTFPNTEGCLFLGTNPLSFPRA